MQNVPTARPTGKDDLNATIQASVSDLANAVDQVRASETFRAFLNLQATLHRYSWNNTLLILSQFPQATQIAGYRTWQKLGRQVRKGQKGIKIFAPRKFTREVERDGETVEEKGIYFRAVSVFDISQTDGEELPQVECPTIAEDAGELLAALTLVTIRRGIDLTYRPLSGGIFGMSCNGRIWIDNTHPTGQQAKTLAHELAHELLHWDGEKRRKSVEELEAESVAYVVCRHFGLDVDVRSSRYIALWGGDADALRASLARISNTAREIIDQVEAVEEEDRQAAA